MNYLERNKQQFIEDLKGLIEIESYLSDVTAYPNNKMVEAVNYMIELGNKEGFTTYADPEGYYGYIEIGKGEKMIGILAHLDVVPPGNDSSKWDTPPFELNVEGDFLRGRGTQDDKGPALLSFYLLKSIVESGIELNTRIRLILPTDEESMWRGVEKYKTDGQEIPSFGITPDAQFPLIYSERELLEFKIKGKPTNEFTFEAGEALNIVPDKAKLTINGETIIEEGKANHAMAPWNGVNAITKLLNDKDIDHDLIKFIQNEINNECNGETLMGELIKDDDQQLAVNLAVLNINEDKAELAIDMRIPNTTNSEEIISKVKAKLTEKYPELTYEPYDHLPGVYIPRESDLVKTLMESYQQVTGDMESQPIATGGATYARGMENIVAFGPYFKDSEMTEHEYNEHVKFSHFSKAFDVYEIAFGKFIEK